MQTRSSPARQSCSRAEFCLSGYPHDEEAERFGRLVMPYFADGVERQPAAATKTA